MPELKEHNFRLLQALFHLDVETLKGGLPIRGFIDRGKVFQQAFDLPFASIGSPLHFLSAVELASMAQLLPDPLPIEFRNEILEMTRSGYLRRVKRESNLYRLTDSLTARVAGLHTLYVEEAVGSSLFFRFLSLQIGIMKDWGLRNSLILLIAGQSPEQPSADFARVPRDLIGKWSDRVEIHGPINSLGQLGSIFQMMEEMHSLIQAAADTPLYQSALWFGFAPLFRSLNHELLVVLLRGLEELQNYEDDGGRKQNTWDYIKKLRGMLDDMTSQKYERRLVYELNQIPEKEWRRLNH